VFAGLLVAAAVAGVAYYRSRPAVPDPPEVGLAVPDPEVAAVIGQAREAVRREPRSGQAWGRYGMVLSAHAYPAEAAACYAQAARLDPDEPRWPYLHALAVGPEDPAAAVPLLRRAAELSGDRDDTARLMLAELLLTQGQPDEARPILLKVLARDPDQPRANLLLGRLEVQAGDPAAGLAYLRRAARSPFTRRVALTLTAEAHRRRGDLPAAEAALKELAAAPPDRPRPDRFADELDGLRAGRASRMGRVTELLAARRYPEAEAALEELAAADPGSEVPLVHLARVRIDRGDPPAAERALRAALARAPDSAHAHFLLGAALFAQKRYAPAADEFRRAAALKPADPLAPYNAGKCLRQLGDRAGAADALRAAVRCKPDFAEAHAELAELRVEAGDGVGAGEAVRAALAVNPAQPAAVRLVGRLAAATVVPPPNPGGPLVAAATGPGE
jgi:Tfp pilus assembly protein PilF